MVALEGLDGIVCVADDILVYGEGETHKESEEDHDWRFIALMERCKQKDLRMNKDKLQFKLREVKFMGNIITDRGMRTDPDKVKAISDMATPHKPAQLWFLGMVNFLSPF